MAGGGVTAAEAPASSQANSQTHPFNYYLLLRVNEQFRKRFKFGYGILHLVQTWEKPTHGCVLQTSPPKIKISLLTINACACTPVCLFA